MPPEVQTAIAALPPWLQGIASAVMFVVVIAIWLSAYRRGGKEADVPPHPIDPAELLAAAPVKALVEALVAIAESTKTQAEAVEALLALIRADYEDRKLERRFREMQGRNGGGQPSGGWGAP
ncbi:hypothetical protein M446_4112 [Methylobacterium sp. 4-46]|uniref:hypothetical protein n=1 Tax=unclassified Methylobacterium TaxID=2615210 RepID=UPI000152E89B|nr:MULTISPECIES: hypothetical protein [Methylobacterium]ACA18470.1 hypothetical protein M446_4112 [Methylobacterium sp. 4-46]WFT77759.1 hypothetical protein QA634_20885 [Methylobacterium nodulans]